MSIYLDYNASTPIDQRVLNIMIDVYRNSYGNADSRTHEFGDNARKIVETARKQVASLLNTKPDEIYFNSGATEGINTIIQGLTDYGIRTGKKHIVTSAIEHKAVLETCKYMEKEGFDVDYIFPDANGRVSAESILSKIRDETLLVALMHVNNETGIIQPVKEVGDALSSKEVFFFVDATQSCGKLVNELRELKYDMLVFSSHKLSGPQGNGVMVLKKKNFKTVPVKPILFGGQQEHGFSPGTIPVALVAGTGEACKLAEQEYDINNKNTALIKDIIVTLFKESGIPYHFNGEQKYCISSTLNVCIENVMSEALMIASKKYCSISNGSACTSKSYEPSYVLKAMGVSDYEAECSVRISWGSRCDAESVKDGVRSLLETAKGFL